MKEKVNIKKYFCNLIKNKLLKISLNKCTMSLLFSPKNLLAQHDSERMSSRPGLNIQKKASQSQSETAEKKKPSPDLH